MIEGRFVIGKIHRALYDKYSSRYKNEYFEIEQDAEKKANTVRTSKKQSILFQNIHQCNAFMEIFYFGE